MLTLKVKGKEYKLKFGYKSFKKSGILREAVAMQQKLGGSGIEDGDSDNKVMNDIGVIEEILELNSKLMLAALQKFHKEFRVNYKDLDSVEECEEKVDDLIDDYMDEENAMDIMTLFGALFNELFEDGFLPKSGETPTQTDAKAGSDAVLMETTD